MRSDLTCAVTFFALCFMVQKGAAQKDKENPVLQRSDATYTLRTSSNLVVLDVVVSGADGRPVHGLTINDFQVRENGRPQKVRDFREHRPDDPGPAALSPPKLAPGLFTNYAQGPSEGPANVLLLDMLNTPLAAQAYARAQIHDYLDRARPGTRMAVFGLGNSLSLLQGFTADPRVLKLALSQKNAARASSILNDHVGSGGDDGTGDSNLSDALSSTDSLPILQEAIANARQFEAETKSFDSHARAQLTLDALNELARYLANVPGRKNVIWFSGSFPISVLPNADIDNGFTALAGAQTEFRDTMRLLAISQVSLYPVDVRGLATTGTYSAASANQKYVRDPQAIGKDIAKFNGQLASENETMLQSARETGGRAFINTNGLTDAVTQAVEDGSNYYALTYTPDDKTLDGRYRRLEVASSVKGLKLAYRQGYYAEDAQASSAAASAHGALATSAKEADTSLMTRSMVRGAPPSTQVQFTIRVRPATGVPEPAPAPDSVVVASSIEMKPPFLRLAIDFAVDPRDFVFAKAGEAHTGDIQFIAFVYDANGSLLSRGGSTLRMNLSPANYQEFLRKPLSFYQDVSIPLVGSYFLRVAVQDLNSLKAGSLEVPLDSVKTLPPLSAP